MYKYCQHLYSWYIVQLNWNGEQQHKSHEFIQIEPTRTESNSTDSLVIAKA